MLSNDQVNTIAKIAALEVDLKATAAIADLKINDIAPLKEGMSLLAREMKVHREALPSIISKEINTCRKEQTISYEKKRRWTIDKVLFTIGICISGGLSILALVLR